MFKSKSNSFFNKTIIVSSLTIAGILPQAAQAQSVDDTPASMGVLGDSMSAGALAKYYRYEARLPWIETFVLARLIDYALTNNHKSIEFPGYSWSGGLEFGEPVESHAWRLKKLNRQLRRSFVVHNSAISGYESTHVRDLELPELNKWSQKKLGQAYPDYVTVLIGANDICENTYEDMRSVGDYYTNVSASIDEMLEKSPNTRILISSLPNIASLRDIAKDSTLTGVGTLMNKCQDFWKTVKLCPTLTTESDPVKRAVIAQRVVDYNTALNDIAVSRAKQYGDRVRFADRPYDIKFNDQDISVDCFHPNPIGQNKIAEATWESSWWANQ